MANKQVTLAHQQTRSGFLRLWMPENWSEESIGEISFTVDREMDYIDTIYYKGTLLYNQQSYTITGAMCLHNTYPQTPAFNVKLDV